MVIVVRGHLQHQLVMHCQPLKSAFAPFLIIVQKEHFRREPIPHLVGSRAEKTICPTYLRVPGVKNIGMEVEIYMVGNAIIES